MLPYSSDYILFLIVTLRILMFPFNSFTLS
ncbi:hypothetical protein [Staphylococcus phage vB_SauM-V1SA19]|nr:hypothetical protein [Staphylococcus phage vB_SauM-V1SA19]